MWCACPRLWLSGRHWLPAAACGDGAAAAGDAAAAAADAAICDGASQIVAMLREREAMGLGEITLLPAMAEARRNLGDFAKQVIARY